MAGQILFVDFVSRLYPDRLGVEDVLNEEVRIFIWTLIDKLQNVHKVGQCYAKIGSEHIFVRDNIPYITAGTIAFSDKAAVANYRDIHSLLTNILFRGMTLPNCFTDFLRLLINEPLVKGYLIARHCSILPTAMHIAFVTNLVEFPPAFSAELRSRFYACIDSVVTKGDWYQNLERGDKFLVDQYNTRDYHSSCSLLNTFTLLKFFRNCVEHAGDQKRSPFENSTVFQKWLSEQEGKPINKMAPHCYDFKKNNVTQFELLHLLYARFPDVLVNIQHALFQQRFLAYIHAIQHFDEVLCSASSRSHKKCGHSNELRCKLCLKERRSTEA